MSIHDYSIGERKFKEFMTFRSRFLSEAISLARYTAKNSVGEKFRPVVMVTPRQLSDVREQIDTWCDYVYELEQYPALNIPSSIMYPLPRLITGAVTVIVYDTPSTFTRVYTVEKVIKSLRAEIKRFAGNSRAQEYIETLQAELAVFLTMPEDKKLRLRYDGFTDTVCNVTYPRPTGSVIDPSAVVERVSANGLFFAADSIKEFRVGSDRDYNRVSIYDFLPYKIASSLGACIYDLDDIERAKTLLAEYKANHPRDPKAKKATYTKAEAVAYLKAAMQMKSR
jgi:hypothetical protein